MASIKVETVCSPLSVLGEGPHWDIDTQSLYYVDIYGKEYTILRYDYAENRTYGAVIDGEPVASFIIPVEGCANEFAVGIGRKIGIINWDGKSTRAKVHRIVLEVEREDKFKTNRFNDAKADPRGRFYGGTMRLEECGSIFDVRNGQFYKYNFNGKTVERLFGDVGVSNGLAWNMERKKFYFIDSCTIDIKEYDYDPESGAIENERVLIDLKIDGKNPGYVPDGMTIDAHGNLYVATWGGSKILKVNTISGKIEKDINLPAEQVTSAAFGGPNLDILYVTTAATDRSRPQPPPAGSLFQITGLDAVGLPMNKVKF